MLCKLKFKVGCIRIFTCCVYILSIFLNCLLFIHNPVLWYFVNSVVSPQANKKQPVIIFLPPLFFCYVFDLMNRNIVYVLNMLNILHLGV
jgi:hypothetical protein